MSGSAEAVAGPTVRPPADLNPRREPVLDFPDRSLPELSPADYAELGFMSGLEVHQQLHTRSKLFCRCPAGRRVDRVDAEVLRHMRPTLSELGEYDGTALMEFKTRKEVVYLLERGTVCTYEMDDTPPFEIDREAVRIAVELAMLCELNLVSELHVMRKQYLDGSIPTGFQRTAMIGLTGAIPFPDAELGGDRPLRIRQLSLEEDSCREVSDVGHRVTFRTDRLGMPLSEVVTEPDLLTPRELQAAGRLIARLARATGKVRRGPGAARQDVNVSVAGGRRVEIKGVPHHRGLPLLVHNEAYRQLNLLRVRAELERRGVGAATLALPDRPAPWEVSDLVLDATGILARTGYAPLRQALGRGETACAVRLPGFGGLLGHRTQPGRSFASEIADRIQVIACPAHRPFMTHSDAGDATLGQRHWAELARALGADVDDAIVVVWAPAEDAATAAREILIRADDARIGVPAETRQAFPDGTTGFERILPGPDRMYPDTDTPPLPIPDAMVTEIRAHLGERPWQREGRYRELGLNPGMARRLADAPWAHLFDQADPPPGPARVLAAALEKRLPFHSRMRARRWGLSDGSGPPRASGPPGGSEPPGRADGPTGSPARPGPGMAAVLDVERLAALARALERGEILPSAVSPALDALVDEAQVDADDVIARYRPRAGDGARLEAAITEVAGRAGRELDGRPRDVVLRWAMGEVMGRFRGRVEPASVRRALEDALEATALEGMEAAS
jgi:glutamyl-tRNA(Gln) amidotransferase subunit E